MQPIDENDEPGAYREAVCAGVLALFGCEASLIASRSDMVGTWEWRAVDEMGEDMGFPPVACQLYEDGRCVSTIPGHPPTEHQWALNADATLSFCYPVKVPVGSALPSIDETRFFVRALADGRRVLWNGDASVVKVFERVK